MGIRPIHGAGSTEAARIKNRIVPAVIGAFMSSGKDLAQNVLDSNVPALVEAWDASKGDVIEDKYAKKVIDKASMLQVGGFILRAPANNWALVRGFSTDRTARQMNRLAADGDPRIYLMAGYCLDSTVSSPEGNREHIDSGRIDTVYEDGDHSHDDNIRFSAARILHFADRATI